MRVVRFLTVDQSHSSPGRAGMGPSKRLDTVSERGAAFTQFAAVDGFGFRTRDIWGSPFRVHYLAKLLVACFRQFYRSNIFDIISKRLGQVFIFSINRLKDL